MAISSAPWTLTARYVFPVAGPPLEGGIVTVAGDCIAAVEPRGHRSADVDLGNAAVLPGLVNAHTHLDLGGLRGRLPPGPDFTAWLRGVVQHRRNTSPEQTLADIRAGIAESLACGTTLLGDIAANGLSWSLLAGAPLRAVVFYETLALGKARAHSVWAGALAWLRNHRPTESCRPGLSPHAPYSVRAALFRAAAALSTRQSELGAPLPLTIHLAETQAELELLKSHRGPFVDYLTELKAWDPQGLVRGPDEVLRLNREVANVLFAHGNYLEAGDLIPPGGTVVYCPRTHAAFGHGPHPFRELLAAGVRVALGTDSLASNPDLDVLAELRFLRGRCPDVPGGTLLRMATLAGAEVLGWAEETGSLAPGKSADLVVLPLPDEDRRDPHDLILESARTVEAVMGRGRWLSPPGGPQRSGPFPP